MIALLLFGLIAGAAAAPQFDLSVGRGSPFFSNYHLQPYGADMIFDTGRFWADISKEMKELDAMLADLSRHLPNSVSQEGIVGNEYKLTISLPEFEEKDIVVKAREGLLLIQASHKYAENGVRNYLNTRTLPNNVNVAGNWIFDKGVLTITFPLKDGAKVPEQTSTSTELLEFGTTKQPEFAGSREEIETNTNVDTGDVDVGLGIRDSNKDNEIQTNEIPDRSNAVEATTYAVNLKDVEFIPAKY